MTNWTDINPDFTPEWQKVWENWKFTYDETREYINVGLTPQDTEFAAFLWNNGYKKSEDLNKDNLAEKRNEYIELKKWKRFNY